jgi:surface protein
MLKKIFLLLPLLTILGCDKTDPDNPFDAKFNNKGCLVCANYSTGESFLLDGVRYTVADKAMLETAIANREDLTRYCTSRIGDMSLLHFQSDFNQNIGTWDVSNVTNMEEMFNTASSFNQNIGSWDVGKVKNMRYMFYNASAFNQDLGEWNVSSVTDMEGMFYNTPFNKDIGNWDVSHVTKMSWMFFGTSSFNQDLRGWCVSNFSSMPGNFATNSALSFLYYPIWGTCP